MQSIQTEDLVRLDRQLEELSKEIEAQRELLREHIESAHVYLVGGMPTGYQFSSKIAGEVLNCVSDRNLRARFEDIIDGTEGQPHAGKKDAATGQDGHSYRRATIGSALVARREGT